MKTEDEVRSAIDMLTQVAAIKQKLGRDKDSGFMILAVSISALEWCIGQKGDFAELLEGLISVRSQETQRAIESNTY